MSRWILVLVLLGFASPLCVRADDDLDKVNALERVLKKVIDQAEPSIACILVTRSETYQEFGQGPDKDHPGKLGSLDLTSLRGQREYLKLSTDARLVLEKKLNFADPNYVPRSFGSGVVIDPDGLVLTN